MISWEGDSEWTGHGKSEVKEPRWGVTATVEGKSSKITLSFSLGAGRAWCR